MIDNVEAGPALTEGEEEFLLGLADAKGHSRPGEPVYIAQIARLTRAAEVDCGNVAGELVRHGLINVSDSPARKLQGSVSLTPAGRDATNNLGALPPLGAIAEFSQELTEIQRSVLDAVVRQELRFAGAGAMLTYVRTVVRTAIAPKPAASAIHGVIDGLVGTHLSLAGAQEPSYRSKLAGLLASSWGRNAIAVLDGLWVLFNGLNTSDPSLQQFSWSALRSANYLPAKALNLACLVVASARLGTGIFEHTGDKWWTVPPGVDLLLEENPTPLDHVRRLIDQEKRATTDRDGGQSGTREASVGNGGQRNEATEMTSLKADPRKVFVIHGRNLEARKQMGIFLRACGLAPINFDDLRAGMGGTPTIADIVERGMNEAQGVVALFTEDEYAGLRPEFRRAHNAAYDDLRWQGRPNVIFESGMAFGRDRTRVVFVLLGNPVLFTDVSGIHLLRPTNDPQGDRKTLRETLRKGMLCAVEDSMDWMSAGDFEGCVGGLLKVTPRDPFAGINEVVDSAIPIVPLPTRPTASNDSAGISLSLSYKALPTSSRDVHNYELRATLRNGSRKRLDDWYVEVELPAPLLDPNRPNATQIRTDGDRSLFRTTAEVHPILAGDEYTYALQYRMNHDVHDKYHSVLQSWMAKARAFVGGEQVADAVLESIENF